MRYRAELGPQGFIVRDENGREVALRHSRPTAQALAERLERDGEGYDRSGDRLHGLEWGPLPACDKHGTHFNDRSTTVHKDGSWTCGTCYMQRARDLGVIR